MRIGRLKIKQDRHEICVFTPDSEERDYWVDTNVCQSMQDEDDSIAHYFAYWLHYSELREYL